MTINPVEVIRRKRDGLRLSTDEIEAFVSGAATGLIPEYQTTAFLMATYFQGMVLEETTALTRAMIASGRQVKFTDSRPKIDKHSTGGVGDKVSLILAPLVAALDVDVPMVSGRGLGHTGGTLDKLESITGFRVHIKIDEFVSLIAKNGLAMMGQTADFVPADKLLYALRDVTATVECIPLITASILSKKVAEGISGLVLDIKVGSGAFMKTQKAGEKLAKSLVAVGTALGLRVRAVLTDMNQPLGLAVGHSVEVLECLETLQGRGPTDLRDITVELAAHMLVLGDKSSSIAAARAMARKSLQDGTALAKFGDMCRAQGATVNVVRNPETLLVSPHTVIVQATKTGYVSKIDGQALGTLLVRMGGGRQKTSDTIDHSVGFRLHAKLGSSIEKGKPLATIYFNPEKLRTEDLTPDAIAREFAAAFSISGTKAKASGLIKKVIE
ncbi:MAG: thymidine phosphorylase [Deltaproteobacteria bacterium]|nr:thymidine phosphorylase [Deltaproteobacteria bacterium]